MSKLDKLRKQFEEDIANPLGRAETRILILEEENYLLWEIVEGMQCPWYGSGIKTFEL